MSVKKLLVNLTLLLGCIITLLTIISLLNNEFPPMDQWLRNHVPHLLGTPLYNFALNITQLGSRHFLIPFTICMLVLLMILYRHFLQALFFSGGTLLSYYLHNLIKHMIQRERPSILIEAGAKGYSFPSGHSMISLVCYGFLLYFLVQKANRKEIKIILSILVPILILSIGLSRYIINVHYMTDIIAGFFFGYLLLRGLIYTYEKVFRSNLNS